MQFTTNSSFGDFLQENNDSSEDEDATSDCDYVDRMVKAIMVRKCTKNVINPARRIARTRKPPKKKRKRFAGAMLWTNPVSRITCPITPFMSQWYNYYVQNAPKEDPRFLLKFRRRFRVPYSFFIELTAELEETEDFIQWRSGSKNCFGSPATPISLLLLAVLRYLGRAWTLDDLAESVCISQECVRSFLHVFLKFGSTVLYQRYVVTPSSADEAENHMAEYSDAGFPGAVGSTDATHILLERVPNKHRQSHLGFKSTHTARAYNITVNHRRRILATTSGYPARWNDKTLALFDPFMQGLHEGKVLDDIVFNLYAYDENGNIVLQPYRGGWLLVDNGYLTRSTTVPPIKTSNSRAEIRFSSWLESLRKDVECTFGILKGRWRILKTGIRIHGTEGPDKVFLTCCALHNKLLDIDGLDERWEQGVPSIWSREYDNDLGDDDNEDEDVDGAAQLPNAIVRLNNPVLERNYGIDEPNNEQAQTTPVSPTAAATETTGIDPPFVTRDRVLVVRKLKLNEFRQSLVVHFSIAVQRNEVQWPRRYHDGSHTSTATQDEDEERE